MLIIIEYYLHSEIISLINYLIKETFLSEQLNKEVISLVSTPTKEK